jgi:hypothetical protein
VYETAEDLREFALGVDGFSLRDGDLEVQSADLAAALQMTLTARIVVDGEHGASKFELGGRLVRKADGSASFEFRAIARGAEPGSYVLTLTGGEGVPFDVPLKVEGRAARTRVAGGDDLFEDALRWTSLVVTLGDQEVGRAELACR